MSGWTHPICDDCWDQRNPGRAPPVRLISPAIESCCFCGRMTLSGVYVRADPATTLCLGAHDDDE